MHAAAALLARARGRRGEGAHVDAAGARLYFTAEGAGSAVLLLHGFAVDGDLNWRWPGVIEALQGDFRVIVPDLRGHGRSDKPHDPAAYGLEMVRDALRLLDHLGIERAHLVGYSLGGFIALKLAVDHPERLISAAVLGAGWEPAGNPTFARALGGLAEELRAGRGIGPLCDHFGPGHARPGPLHRGLVHLLTRYFNDGAALAALVATLPELALAEPDLAALRLPLCAIVGRRDPFRSSAEALAARVASCRLVIVDDADHLSALRRPATLKALRTFLRETDTPLRRPATPAFAQNLPYFK